MIRIAAALIAPLLLAIAACTAQPARKVSPALWEVTGPSGEKAWLFATIHALPKPVDWRSARVESALAGSGVLVMEIANPDDPAAIGRLFRKLGESPGHPPPTQRVPAELRPAMARLLDEYGMADDDFSGIETWSLALTLSRRAQGDSETAHGMEAALLEAARRKPVRELEGADYQLRGFDALPEAEQRDLLAAVVREAAAGEKAPDLAAAWANGDMATIERETNRGLLADPELRTALFVNRNRAWAGKAQAMIAQGQRPFIAVGAAHMAGPEGLPALLAARGMSVHRLQ